MIGQVVSGQVFLWYVYEYTRDDEIRKQAERYSSALFPVVDRKADNHDLGL